METSTRKVPPGPATEQPPAPVGRPLDACPACRSWQLRAVVDAEAARVHFLCGSCNRCWRVELGYARRVHPDRCDGCPQPQVCAAAYEKDQSRG
jgi:hypothetical protein